VSQVTVRAVLFGDSDPAAAVGATPAWRTVLDGLGAVLATLSPSGQADLYREVTAAVGGLLSLDVVDVLVGGWRKHHALVAAAQRTRADPAAIEQVELASHRITTTHRPYLDITVNGVKVATVHFDLGLTLDLDTMLGQVRQARLVGIQGGRCTVTAGLGCQGVPLASRQLVFDPNLTLPLAQGIPLLAERPSAPVGVA
jgi:hypothetical protein